MKKYDQKITLLSLINEKILNRSTEERYRLMQASRTSSRKKWIPILSIAASAALLLAVLIPIFFKPGSGPMDPGYSEYVPVYTGMTVSSATENAVLEGGAGECRPVNVSYRFEASELPSVFKDPTKPGGEGEHTKEHENQKDPFGEIQASQDMYVAKSGEKVHITIHFDNPKQYEILSFTINGIKYGSHMFLQGSNMENLTVEYDVPADAEGILECTIDAIKYVDGTQIKDVKIGGDQTIQIMVYRIYSITYDLGDDVTVLEELPTFYYKDLDTSLSAGIQKLRCIFEGWTYEGQSTPVMTIPKGTTGDLVLTPVWRTTKDLIDYLCDTLGGGSVIKGFDGHFDEATGKMVYDHNGVDIAVSKVSNVVAADDGTVTMVSRAGTDKMTVYIELPDWGITVIYHNLDSASVVAGDVVKRGDVIGIAEGSGGNRRNCSSEPCIHVGIRVDNVLFDPYPQDDEK
ncbi:MAG: peptidoglycan DD-metalloendopeptidase family protein [Clostridia bacterium]|nr:peptidoglycan DD-metalloendopeptidase family protein [Clostridia bacterium]